MMQAATFLRAHHEATLGSSPVPGDRWQLPLPADLPGEVVCHNDFAPYNVVIRDRRLVGVIDFDTVGPGAGAWDVAYAAYRFVPLSEALA